MLIYMQLHGTIIKQGNNKQKDILSVYFPRLGGMRLGPSQFFYLSHRGSNAVPIVYVRVVT